MNVATHRIAPGMAPVGDFVHHQGRGHAERCAAIVNALPADRPVTVYCALPHILAPLRAGAEVVQIPSLFEPTGRETAHDFATPPDTVHCAPLGWPGIRAAMGRIAQWFATENPALMICDVSAELAQLARLCSVPHVKIHQHGHRTDPGHRVAYDGAACLAQTDWDSAMLVKTFFAGGLGVEIDAADRETARRRIGVGG